MPMQRFTIFSYTENSSTRLLETSFTILTDISNEFKDSVMRVVNIY